MQLHQLISKTKTKKEKRVGRGGKRGTFSGKGTKGQRARAGHKMLPDIRAMIIRIPKLKGLKHKSLVDKPIAINLADITKKIKEDIITKELLAKYRLIRRKDSVKILATGEISRPITIKGMAVSKKAKEAIEAKGGKVEK